MKAIVYHKYGSPDVLELQEIDKPVVNDDDVLVRVHAASVNTADWVLMTGTPYIGRIAFGLLKPKRKIPGSDVAGRVEAVGRNVTQFQPGDEVFGESEGTFAEYVSVSEDTLALKPANLTFEQAAAVPLSANTALQGLRDQGKVQPGQKVLINGASGAVGTFAVQIAKFLGAEVTGVCSTRNVDMARSIGADHVVDYTQEDFTQNGQRYDVMFDLVGNHSLSACRRVLESTGTYISSAGQLKRRWLGPAMRLLRMLLLSRFVSQKMVTFIATPTKADLVVLKEALEAGKVTPVIDRRYVLSEVPEALRYQGEGHARGKIVITV
jgi:NADPH:quinone reductase-like Zn-dependent oxidoreductase